MIHKKTIGEKTFDVFNIIFFILLGIIMVFPLWNILMTSLVSAGEFYSRTIILWPNKIDISSYVFIFSEKLFYNAVVVTVFVTVVGTIYCMLLTTMIAYPLTKKYLPGRNFFLLLITLTMFLSGGLIPYYLLIKSLGLMNSVWALIIPTGVGVWYFLVIKTFFTQLPVELEESAEIDGAGHFRIFCQIILPVSLPVLATFSLFYAVGFWNSWYDVVLFIQDQKWFTIQYIIREMIVANADPEKMVSGSSSLIGEESRIFQEGVKMAAIVVTMIPILCVYPFLQKYFMKGMLIGSIKG